MGGARGITGGGEILLTSMDTDGVQKGFDCALTRAVSRATHIPVIASGGAGEPERLRAGPDRRRSHAALAASIFHYGTYTVGRFERALTEISRHSGETRMIAVTLHRFDGR